MTTNDITKDKLISKSANDAFLEGWERIFGNPEKIDLEEKKVELNDEYLPVLSIGALRKKQAC